MECIILAGGLGTRLKEVVSAVPKPLAPINGRPFLDLLLCQLMSFQAIEKVILAVGYKSESILDYYRAKAFPFAIEFSIETTPQGTGGALQLALEKVRGEEVLVLNGDSYLDFSFKEMRERHEAKKADFTMACLKVEGDSRYGAVIFDENEKIITFSEKTRATWINGGIYLFKKKILPLLPPPFSLEKDVFPLLLNKRMFGYPCLSTFIDIGTKESYYQAQEILRGRYE